MGQVSAGSVRSFAFIIAANIVVDMRRKRRVLTTSLLNYEEVADEGPGPDTLLMLLVGHRAIEQAVEQVDEVHRDVVRLSLVGRDHVQIAAELDIPYNTVKSRLGRGRAQALNILRTAFGVELA